MQLQFIEAIPHPAGSRVDLRWLNPRPDLFSGVRIMRRETTHPLSPTDGELVTEKENNKLFDLNWTGTEIENLDKKDLSPMISAGFLSHQIILSTGAAVSVIEPGTRWQVIDNEQITIIIKNNGKLEVYGTAAHTDQGLHAEMVYYYTFFPYKGDPRDYLNHRGNRVSVQVTGPYDFAGRLYRMLPTVYHRYDKVFLPKSTPGNTDQDKQKGQLQRFLELPGLQLDQIYSFAAAALDLHNIYRVDGKLLALLAQWIGWITDYNLEISGQRNELQKAPALYRTIGIVPAIEAAIVKCIGGWESSTKEFLHNVFLSNHPEQLNLWITQRDSIGQWQEPNEVFSLDFAYEGRPTAAQDENGTLWLFYHTQRNNRWEIWYKTLQQDQTTWTPSQPLSTGKTKTIDKHPAAALQDKTLWVFWNSYDPGTQTWGIQCRQRTNGQWNEGKLPVTGNQCKSPQTVTDHQNRLWLFWLEKPGTRWVLKYNRNHNGAWEDTSAEFPLEDDGTGPGVEKDLFVLFHTKDSTYSIWLYWTRKKSRGITGQECWEIAYRQKIGVEIITGGWQPIRVLPKAPPGQVYDDGEPAAIVNTNNEIELYWASNRTGRSWSLWNSILTEIEASGVNSAKMVINDPYTQRTPLPIQLPNGISLVYRSNKSISYKSQVYRATETTDFRYAGSITVDTRNKARNAMQGMYDDFRTYTYDTGENGKPTNNNWYARDTVGLYLKPDTDDQQLITRNREVIKGILERFLPIQNRTVFIIEPPMYRESIYTYDSLGEDKENPRYINEQFFDSNIPEGYPGVKDKHEDNVPGWTWLCSWGAQSPDHQTVDFREKPVTTKFRTWHIAIKNNGKDEEK